MPRLLLLVVPACKCFLVGTFLFQTACRKPAKPVADIVPAAPVAADPAPTTPAAGAPAAPAAPASVNAVATFLNSSEFADLSKAYQVFYLQKKRHTADLQELVKERYLRTIPPPPPGKSYAIDQKNLRVLLVP